MVVWGCASLNFSCGKQCFGVSAQNTKHKAVHQYTTRVQESCTWSFFFSSTSAVLSVFLMFCRSTILDNGQNLDSEALICLPGQIDIRCYMLPTKPVKPVMDLVADEEAARAMGLDFGLEEMEDVQHVEDH